MNNIRIDKETGKTYNHFNIPIEDKGTTYFIQNSKGFFKIISENHNHPEDSWYNGRFIGDRYAVFEWVNATPSQGLYQQITPWYYRFGYAKRMLLIISKESA